jgi:hypothetical protein
MSELSSVNKIKSLKQQIEQVTGESHSDLTVAIQALKDGYGNSGGSGGAGGIIDVTELPTSNIDTNAVYRVTERVQTEKTEVYVRNYLNGTYMVLTAQQYLAYLGVPTVPNIYVVDELTNLKTTDVQYFTELNLYILRSDGICYLNVPAYGGIITLGLFGFQATGYDKGFTDNVYEETDRGVYTTIEAYKEVIRYFIRKNGNWEEISATMIESLSNGLNLPNSLSGSYSASPITILQNGVTLNIRDTMLNERTLPSKVTIDVPCTADLLELSPNFKNVSKEYFRRKDGSFITFLNHGAFAYQSNIVSVDMPDTIEGIGSSAFEGCQNLLEISLPDSIIIISSLTFSGCQNLHSVILPSNLSEIGTQAFLNCHKLTSITIPQGLTVIGAGAFEGCQELSFNSLPNSLTRVESSAFKGCLGLTSITFKSECYIGWSAFSDCSNLTTINVPWSEGTVSGSPWGATNATINYNYTGE